jgi:porin
MNIASWQRQAIAVAATVLSASCANMAWGQDATTPASEVASTDVSSVGKIGRLHDNLRRAKQRESLYQELTDLYAGYIKAKSRFASETNISYSMDVSLLQQWGFSNGGSPALQVYAAPSLDWTLFTSKDWGTGSVQVAYNAIPNYPTAQDATDIQSNLGLITPINDWPSRTFNFAQLTYTQATPDNKWLLTVGQYPLYNFDGNAYLGNQQQNFNNYLFAQNASQTYLLTGLGTYVQFNASSTVQFAAGLQGTNNVSGQTLTATNFNDNCCAWFGYFQWAPKFPGMGSAQYSISYFDTPSIPAQPSTRGWSVNAVQNLDSTWAVFARANGANGYVTPIKSAYALGVAMNNPLKRSPTDQVAIAVGLSDAAGSPTNPPGARNEKVVEAYWNWTFFGGLLLTPSVQVLFDPALNPSKSNVSVLSLRATLMF